MEEKDKIDDNVSPPKRAKIDSSFQGRFLHKILSIY